MEVDLLEPPAIKEEEQQFRLLCDEVTNALALMHTSLLQFIDLKDLLLNHNLPPNVALRISLVAGDIFRSFSDMKITTGEMVRVIRVYSSSWETKSAVLKKMHDDYQRKTSELNIALHKLAIQEAEIHRCARERRVMNWEKLFTRVQMARGHGRRWKFRIHDFKKKATLGIENLREYFHIHDGVNTAGEEDDHAEAENDNEDEEEPEMTEGAASDDEKDDSEEEEPSSELSPELLQSRPKTEMPVFELREYSDLDFAVDKRETKSKRAQIPTPAPVERKIVKERGIMTTEQIDFETFLNLNISGPVFETSASDPQMVQLMKNSPALEKLFKPQIGAGKTPLRCVISYAGQEYRVDELPTASFPKMVEPTQQPVGKKRMNSKWRTTDVEPKPIKESDSSKEDPESTIQSVDIQILIPKDVVAGANMDPGLENILIKIIGDEKGTVIARGEITLQEIQEPLVPVISLHAQRPSSAAHGATEIKYPYAEEDRIQHPLQCSLNVENQSLGHLPLQICWIRKEMIKRSNRASSAVQLLKRDTGCSPDVVEMIHEELQNEPNTMSAAVSPRAQTPAVPSIPKTIHDDIVANYERQLTTLEKTYEQRIQSLAEEIQESRASQHESTDRGVDPIIRVPSAQNVQVKPRTPSASHRHQRKNSGYIGLDKGISWNSELDADRIPPMQSSRHSAKVSFDRYNRMPQLEVAWPEDFLERLDHYSHLSTQHKQELTERIRREVGQVIEQRMAEAYKLSVSELPDSMDINDSLQDVCLPALFMPQTNSSGTLYNPRAHQYFHPIGLRNIRLSQPPSVFQLPAIKPQQVSVLNMFDMCRNIRRRGHKNSGNPQKNKDSSQDKTPQEMKDTHHNREAESHYYMKSPQRYNGSFSMNMNFPPPPQGTMVSIVNADTPISPENIEFDKH